jgi:hypothetical protein
VPRKPGIYGWWFAELPAAIDPARCHVREGLTLLYAGISPKKPSADGRVSRQSLRPRIRSHYARNASESTLRLTLGCLLADRLGLELRRCGMTGRRTFGAGEKELSRWMDRHAFVSWIEDERPWILEDHLIAVLDLPLNLDQNKHNAFHATLTAAREQAKRHADTSPILPAPGVGGRLID